VLHYYHHGCKSWTWYYPQLYGPLASDLRDLASLNPSFETGRPFTPLLQLLSVLPPQSAPLLPASYAQLMTSASSPLAPFYPRDFSIDANGKKNSWEYIVQIPFLPEQSLLQAVDSIDHSSVLTVEERLRNLPGSIHYFRPANYVSKATTSRDSAQGSKEGHWGNALKQSSNSPGRGSTPTNSSNQRKPFHPAPPRR
jgi:5'-3' exonuclease